MKEYSVCYSLDLNYLEQLSCSIASMLSNARADESIKFYILCSDLNYEAQKQIETLRKIKQFEIEYIKVNNSDFSELPMLKEKGGNYAAYHVTKPTYYRFKLPDLLKNLNKVLYLDCDAIIKGNLEPLFMLDLKDYSAAAVIDADFEKEAERLGLSRYFNAGVMLINLEYWRENNISSKLFDFARLNKEKIIWQDQDILNSVLKNTIFEMPEIWNYQYFQYETPSPEAAAKSVILHLAGRFKPWIIPFESEIYDLYYEYLKLTPFKNKILQYRLNSSCRRLKNNTGGRVTNIAEIPARAEIKKCFDFVIEQDSVLSAQTDEKISKVYDEISKNYKYTEELSEKVQNKTLDDIARLNSAAIEKTDEKIYQLQETADEIRKLTDKKLEAAKNEFESRTEEIFLNIQDEIIKNRQHSDELNKNFKESLEKEINQLKAETASEIAGRILQVCNDYDSRISKISNEIAARISQVCSDYEGRISKLCTDYSEAEKAAKAEINAVYSAVNDYASNLYKEITASNSALEENLNFKIKDLYKKYELQKDKISSASAACADAAESIQRLYSKSASEYEFAAAELKSEYEEKLNNQRSACETRLSAAENKINEINSILAGRKKSPLSRLLEKFRKKI